VKAFFTHPNLYLVVGATLILTAVAVAIAAFSSPVDGAAPTDFRLIAVLIISAPLSLIGFIFLLISYVLAK